jgi:proline racemase
MLLRVVDNVSPLLGNRTVKLSKLVNLVGAHAEGEIGKVITGGVLDIPGSTVLEKLQHIATVDDHLVKFCLFEPRGAAQMSVNLLLPPSNPEADAAFVPLQPDGPHAMSGSNAMCVVTVLLETGILPMVEPITSVTLDTAAGLVKATAICRDGKCERVSLDFFPSFVEHLDHLLVVDGVGELKVDVAFGGCYFALVDAEALGIRICPENARKLVELGTRIRAAANDQIKVKHPALPGLDTIEYALFCEKEGRNIKNGNVIFPGRMDRSPCGTGTAARLAVLHARGELEIGEEIESRSIIDSVFSAQVSGTTTIGGRSAVLPRLSGRAWIYSQETQSCDPTDPFKDGYTLPDTWGEGFLAT